MMELRNSSYHSAMDNYHDVPALVFVEILIYGVIEKHNMYDYVLIIMIIDSWATGL